jgi:MoaA/NifB/PqqE/SkfB family radical SAM enzyme
VFLSGGEPTLVPELEEILKEAKRTFPFAVTLVTNLYNESEVIKKVMRTALSLNINIQTSLDGLGKTGDFLRGGHSVSDTVLEHMEWISDEKIRLGSHSLLYANTVINMINLSEIPAIIEAVQKRNWMSTTGMYHTLTSTTRRDSELLLQRKPELVHVIDFLTKHPNVYTLKAFLRGVPDYLSDPRRKRCLYLDQPILGSRICIMEDGNVYLCKGEPIGNIFRASMDEILSGRAYRERLDEYRHCPGCWTACYTQRSLLLRPGSFRDIMDVLTKMLRLGYRKMSRVSRSKVKQGGKRKVPLTMH